MINSETFSLLEHGRHNMQLPSFSTILVALALAITTVEADCSDVYNNCIHNGGTTENCQANEAACKFYVV